MSKNYQVECPSCHHEFNVEDVLINRLREELEKELSADYREKLDEVREREKELEKRSEQFDKELREKLEEEKLQLKEKLEKKANEEVKARFEEMKTANEEKDTKLQEYREKEVEFLRKKRELEEKEDEMQLQFEKRLSEELNRQKAKLSASNELVLQEKQEYINQLKNKIEALKKGADQGSMQIQGEAQERAIEDLLIETFKDDHIEEVPKGQSGTDCIMTVRNHQGQVCGKIVIESKQTKHFSNAWLPKLKEDMLALNANLPVLVTSAMPEGMKSIGLVDGVWVCSYYELINLITLLRFSLLKTQEVKVQEEDKEGKMQDLYSYMTSERFKQRIYRVFESLKDMNEQLEKEKRAFTSQWKKREKQITATMESFFEIYSSVCSIAGSEGPNIKELELDNLMIEK